MPRWDLDHLASVAEWQLLRVPVDSVGDGVVPERAQCRLLKCLPPATPSVAGCCQCARWQNYIRPSGFTPSRMAMGIPHDLGRHARIFNCIMMLERDAEVCRDVRQRPSSSAISRRPDAPRDHGAVDPCRLNGLEPIVAQRPVQSHAIEARVTDKPHPTQKLMQLHVDIPDGGAGLHRLCRDPVNPNIHGIERNLGINEC